MAAARRAKPRRRIHHAGKCRAGTAPGPVWAPDDPDRLGACRSSKCRPTVWSPTVYGKPVQPADLRAFLTVMPPQNQQDLLKNRQRLLVSYGMVKRLAAAAEQAKAGIRTAPGESNSAAFGFRCWPGPTIDKRLSEVKVPLEEWQRDYTKPIRNRFVQAKVKHLPPLQYRPRLDGPTHQARR